MTDTNRPAPTDEPMPDTADLLITRMIDGESSADDERAFAQLADSRPGLWRDLAIRQRDAALLTAAVERRLAVADRITLAPSTTLASSPQFQPTQPARERDAIPFPQAARTHLNWLFASAGWAAAIALLLLWRLAPGSSGTFDPQQPPRVQHASQLSPEEQFRSYLQAPYVIGELEPVMERIDTLSDGRHAVLLQRRIQEVVFLDENDPLPVDEERHFEKDPAELRTVPQ